MRAKIFVAAMVLLALTACAPSPEEQQKSEAADQEAITRQGFETQYKLKDGRTVTCILWDGVGAGGLSCDWSNAR